MDIEDVLAEPAVERVRGSGEPAERCRDVLCLEADDGDVAGGRG